VALRPRNSPWLRWNDNKRCGDRGTNTVDFDICVRRISEYLERKCIRGYESRKISIRRIEE